MNKIIAQKLKSLPKTSGVYLYRDKVGKVIYVGKAVNLRNRVSSYFNNSDKDPKTIEMVKHIQRLDTIETGSEFEALILESDLVKRYKPRYNIRLRDDKGYVYLKITKEDYSRISVTRQITDAGAQYLGPFIDALAVRDILKKVRKLFPYCSCSRTKDDVCLYFHLGLCPGHSAKYITPQEYAKNIRGIKKLFAGKTKMLRTGFLREMKAAVKREQFELAANYRDKLKHLEKIEQSHFISERDLAADVGLVQLGKALGMTQPPARIECFDISNIMGTAAVGSMAVFVSGVASPKDYRRFQIRTVKGSNDFAMLAEVLSRRFKTSEKRKEKSEKSGPSGKKTLNSFRDSFNSELPDLVILDGGKGQLSAVLKNVQIPEGVTVIALAKRLEEIFIVSSIKYQVSSGKNHNTLYKLPATSFEKVILPNNSEAKFLVQRIRDEAHRFAVTYHRKVKSREMYETSLDAIPGVGPKTKKKLLKEFGSIQKIKEASTEELSKIVPKTISEKIKETI